jgi:hypothetical protein
MERAPVATVPSRPGPRLVGRYRGQHPLVRVWPEFTAAAVSRQPLGQQSGGQQSADALPSQQPGGQQSGGQQVPAERPDACKPPSSPAAVSAEASNPHTHARLFTETSFDWADQSSQGGLSPGTTGRGPP